MRLGQRTNQPPPRPTLQPLPTAKARADGICDRTCRQRAECDKQIRPGRRRTSIRQAPAGKNGAGYAPPPSGPHLKPLSIAPSRARSCLVWISQKLLENTFEPPGLLCQIEVVYNVFSAGEAVALPQFLILH